MSKARARPDSPAPQQTAGSTMTVVRRLYALAGIHPARLLLPVGLGAIGVIAAAGLLGLAGYLICRAAEQPPILSLTVLIVAVRAVALLRPPARYGERLSSHDLAFRSLSVLRTKAFAAIEPLAPAGLDAYRDGELLSRMVSDIDALQDLWLRLVLPVGTAALSTLVIVTGVTAVSRPAGLTLAAGLVSTAIGPPAIAALVVARAARRQAILRARLTADLVDALDAAEELWLNGADDRVIASITEHDVALVEAGRQDARGAGLADALGIALCGLTIVSVLTVTAAAASRGDLDSLLVAPLTFVALAAFEGVLPLSQAARRLPSLLSSGRRVLELIDTRPDVVDPKVPMCQPAGVPAIRLRSPTVERPPGFTLLEGLRVDIRPGERLVVSGPSGAGKTTVAHLLVRFIDHRSGEALLDEHDIRAYRQDDVRRCVLLSAQDPHVFNSNIRENVAFARPGAGEADIIDALARAQLGRWVASLPDGLDTRVGEGGRALSGGERQRLALARALLADAPVCIFDEPTAHLDADTTQALLEDLWKATDGRSVILITHGTAGPFAQCPEVVLTNR